jgi:hypothetical protein
MPVARRPTAWGSGILGLAVLACGIRGRTGRQRTIRMPAVLGQAGRRPGVLGRAVRRRGGGRARTGRARKVQHAGRMPEVPESTARMPEVRGPTVRKTGVRGRAGRTAGDLGRRTGRARRARQRVARRAGDRGQGMAGGPAAWGKHAVLGPGGPCRNKAERQARRGHLPPVYAVRVREDRTRLATRACGGLRRAVLGREGRTRLAAWACRGLRRAVLRRERLGRLAILACRGPRRARGGRARGDRGQRVPGAVVLARGALACRGLGRERGGRGRSAVLVRWRRGRLGGRRWAGRGEGARAGGRAAVRRRPGPGARAVPLMAFPQQ